MSGTAVISDDGRYRYRLTRRIDGQPASLGMTFVMLNPSTADADINDQTIRRCMGYARRAGCGQLTVVNLYAYRATFPSDLRDAAEAGVDVVGPENLYYVDEAMRTGLIVVAWGANAATCPPTPVAALLANWSGQLWCIGTTKDGHPRHPSRGGYQDLVRWSPLAVAS